MYTYHARTCQIRRTDSCQLEVGRLNTNHNSHWLWLGSLAVRRWNRALQGQESFRAVDGTVFLTNFDMLDFVMTFLAITFLPNTQKSDSKKRKTPLCFNKQ